MKHASALKKITPIDIGPVSDKDIEVEGTCLDAAANRIIDLLQELHPSTTSVLIDRWEGEYGVTSQPGATIETRRRNLLAQYISVGSLSRASLITAAAALGYEIKIAEGGEAYPMFRVGASQASNALYDPKLMWVWAVTTRNKPAGSDLISLFNGIKPPHTKIVFSQE